MGFKSGWCSHYSTCCENRKPSPTGQADSVKSAQCVDRCVVENGGCDGKRKCTSTRGVATCGNCRAPFINDGATGCKNPALKKDPCKTNNGGCHSKRKCTSTNGRVTCGNCPAGYVNNGVNSCSEVVDPCKTNNGGCHGKRKSYVWQLRGWLRQQWREWMQSVFQLQGQQYKCVWLFERGLAYEKGY